MRLSLTQRQRALLLFLSASGYTAWFSGLGERTNAEDLGAVPQPFVTIDVRPDLPRVASLIARDPFAGKPSAGSARAMPSDRSHAANAAGADNELAVANLPGASDAVTVPDIANAGAVPVAALTLVLRATIVGPNPVAYVANGTAMDIVRVGDTLGDRRVAKIDLRGIAFDDGTRLDLPVSYVATPQPARRHSASGDRVTLESLRRLLLPARDQQASAARATQTQPPPQPTQTATFPTPGALPTVNTQGLPVGVNPTSDPNGATPYPNPYPYAPPAHH